MDRLEAALSEKPFVPPIPGLHASLSVHSHVQPMKGSTMLTKKFGLDALERAVKTFAQSLLALLTVGSAITDIDWGTAAEISATAAVISLLTSVVSLPLGDSGTASVVSTDQG